MKRYRGNQKVTPGIYLNLQQISFKSMEHEGHLPGTERDEYRRVPTLAMLLLGPVVGGTFVIFLPLIGFAMLTWIVGGKVAEVAANAAEGSVRVLRPAWEPARAFLSRGKPAKEAKKDKDGWAEDVKKELEEGDDDAA